MGADILKILDWKLFITQRISLSSYISSNQSYSSKLRRISSNGRWCFRYYLGKGRPRFANLYLWNILLNLLFVSINTNILSMLQYS